MGSHTPRAFAPDPSKWIDTASTRKKQGQQAGQRPLVAFKHNVPTPPSSNRRPGAGKANHQVTPLGRQPSLSGFLTPTTGPKHARQGNRLDKLRGEIITALKEDAPTARRVPVVNRRMNDFWGSDQDEPAGPSAGPSRPRNQSPPVDTTEEVGEERPRHHVPLASQPIRSSHLPPPGPTDTPRSPPLPSSPGLPTPSRMMTPIPDEVLAIHRRLCGRDTQRMKGVKSPWRKHDASPVPSQKRPRPQAMKMEQAQNKGSGRAKDVGRPAKGKQLVQLSDEEEEEEEEARGPMRDIHPNAGRKNTAKPPSPVKMPPARQPTRAPNRPAVYLDEKPPELTHAHPSTTSPARPHTPSEDAPSEDAPYQTSPLSLSLSLTPRKASPPPHHKVTPPKSRTPQKISEHDETLFALPPPRQPRFVEEPRRKKEWRPVQMEAETLLTWSLGGSKSSLAKMESLGGQEGENGASVGGLPPSDPPGERTSDQQLPPSDPPLEPPSDPASEPLSDPVDAGNAVGVDVEAIAPLQSKRKRSNSASSNTESLAQSVASQSFPHLVSSSPKRSTGALSKCDDPSSDHVDEITPRARKPRTSAERWKALEGGILSVPVPSPASPNAPGKTPKALAKASQALGKKRKSEESASQSKLASFGFFSDGKKRARKSEGDAFDAEWEAEANLEFEQQEEAPQWNRNTDQPDDHHLGALPPAPYHPLLRKAGIEELKRRQANDEKGLRAGNDGRLLAATPATPSVRTSGIQTSDVSSSMTSSELFAADNEERAGAGHEDESAREWFERIQQRRSSEFGSFEE